MKVLAQILKIAHSTQRNNNFVLRALLRRGLLLIPLYYAKRMMSLILDPTMSLAPQILFPGKTMPKGSGG